MKKKIGYSSTLHTFSCKRTHSLLPHRKIHLNRIAIINQAYISLRTLIMKNINFISKQFGRHFCLRDLETVLYTRILHTHTTTKGRKHTTWVNLHFILPHRFQTGSCALFLRNISYKKKMLKHTKWWSWRILKASLPARPPRSEHYLFWLFAKSW